MKINDLQVTPKENSHFYEQVGDFLDSSKQFAKKQLDTTIAMTYYEVGRMIVEREQKGKERAKYGTKLLQGLAEYLSKRHGKGYSIANLRNMRQFYQIYMPQIGQTVSSEFENNVLTDTFDAVIQKQQTVSSEFKLSWSHYQILMRIDNINERKFYEIEATNLQWGVRELRRQASSSLYERLALSRDKDKVMELAHLGQVVDSLHHVILQYLQ